MREIVKSQTWAISFLGQSRLVLFLRLLWEIDYLAMAAVLMRFFQKNYLLLAKSGIQYIGEVYFLKKICKLRISASYNIIEQMKSERFHYVHPRARVIL